MGKWTGLWLGLVLAAGCGQTPGGQSADGGSGRLDSGPATDAGAEAGTDGGVAIDAAADLDGGWSADAGLADGGITNAPPTLVGRPDFAMVDAPFSFMATASDPDGDTLAFSAGSLPTWVQLDEDTGELTGSPTVADIGLYPDVVLTASDGLASASITFDLVVEVSALEAALRSGDHRHVLATATYLDALRQEITDRVAAGTLPANSSNIVDMLTMLESDGFSFDLGACTGVNCPGAYDSEFRNPLDRLRAAVLVPERAGIDIFAAPSGYRYEKLAVLIADHYRSTAYFPINRVVNRQDFLEQLLADHIVFSPRRVNLAQPDLGNYSRSDFSHIAAETAAVTITSRPPFRAAGVYALPGQTVRVTRTDNALVTTAIRAGTIRPHAVQQFDSGGYNRPKLTTTEWLPVGPGQTVYLTTPYGGPLQVSFDQTGVDVTLTFENVGRHPFWSSPSDSAAFNAALAANQYDWAEFVTPDLELHTPTTKMLQTLNHPWVGDVDSLHADVVGIFIRYPYLLAGYAGAAIDMEPEVHDFAASNGLNVQERVEVQHVNADQAACPSTACGGNPYDTDSPFNPHSQTVDIHELGHSIEPRRTFAGWTLHAHTDLYYQYAAYRLRQLGISNVGAALCRTIDHKAIFDIVQASRGEADPFAYMQSQGLEDSRRGIAIYMQLFALAEHAGSLSNGWYALSRLQVIEREFDIATTDDAIWNVKAAGLGFAGIARADAMALSRNDWHLIVLGHAMQLDLRDYLTAWGFSLGEGARDHVAGLGYPAAPLTFYAMSDSQQCDTGLSTVTPVAIDGTSPWP